MLLEIGIDRIYNGGKRRVEDGGEERECGDDDREMVLGRKSGSVSDHHLLLSRCSLRRVIEIINVYLTYIMFEIVVCES